MPCRSRSGAARPSRCYKLFYDEDVRLYTPRDVLAFRPVPEYVSYQ